LSESKTGDIERYLNFVVVGGGPTGVETAGSLAEIKKNVIPADYKELDANKMQVHLIEAAPRVLAAMSEISSKKAQQFLEELGVHVQTNTAVQTYDADISGVSEITFEVDGIEKASVNTYGLNVGNLRFNNNSISNVSNDNILLDNTLNIANKTSVPSTPTGYVKLYSSNVPGNGGTGLYFVNTTGVNDELVSKTRALLYALIL
jgi:NADH dehydrogenase FAD-containing subunit